MPFPPEDQGCSSGVEHMHGIDVFLDSVSDLEEGGEEEREGRKEEGNQTQGTERSNERVSCTHSRFYNFPTRNIHVKTRFKFFLLLCLSCSGQRGAMQRMRRQ